jgi:hypothetical protein
LDEGTLLHWFSGQQFGQGSSAPVSGQMNLPVAASLLMRA